ncbi:hypothetical protein POVWA2_044990 [Plasmodium ovale wallikeri]|uniref:Uncharacterized protein n=1 Tax=Plasmodium ovale wallikeri TaxID=864142 RepID=A0A1A8ZGG1_PLAOA|nr:hypothetical protein POVWA2_044990 [Plasmodium ovale wallikeri]
MAQPVFPKKKKKKKKKNGVQHLRSMSFTEHSKCPRIRTCKSHHDTHGDTQTYNTHESFDQGASAVGKHFSPIDIAESQPVKNSNYYSSDKYTHKYIYAKNENSCTEFCTHWRKEILHGYKEIHVQK